MGNYIVIGANGGIGAALSRRLIDRGETVVLAGRNEGELKELADELDQPFRVVDATDLGAVDELVEGVVEEHGPLAGICNCAGSVVLKPAHLTTPEEWSEIVATNLSTAFATVRAGAKAMRSDGGTIVLLSTAAAQTGVANHEAIAASKGGVDALVRSAAATYGARGIRVNAVAPGLVKTKQTQRLTENETQAETSRSMHVLGRLGEPDDVASALEWLLDPVNDWVTGQTLGVDGGLSEVRTRMKQ